jgi:AGZA family xanthine/uracil permease-like MFS transporter
MSLSATLDRHFALSERGTTLRTEVLAGATTFLTMAYIILVNPAILGQAAAGGQRRGGHLLSPAVLPAS